MYAEPLLRAQERAEKSRSPVRKFLWRKRVWFESTFALSVMEPWERMLVLTFFIIALMLVCVAAYRALPATLGVWTERTMFYLHGNETSKYSRGMAFVHGSL